VSEIAGERSWPEAPAIAPEPANAPAHVDPAGAEGAPEVRNGTGPSRFFRAIKEGVLGRRSENEPPPAEAPRAEPVRVEPARIEPVRVEPVHIEPVRVEPARVETPQPEPESSGPPRKGWWSNKE